VPEKDSFVSGSGRLDREALMAVIDARVNEGFERMFKTFMLPLHEQNRADSREMKATLGEVVQYMHRSQGGVTVAKEGMGLAEKIFAGLFAVAAFVIGLLWHH